MDVVLKLVLTPATVKLYHNEITMLVKSVNKYLINITDET